MINNRQGGRRRGRGGQRPQGMPSNSGGNRQDNRQRGNAAQLLEKYKSMARDSQQAGDRVQTEYYLQYADHYFRVLEDSRSRFEQQEAQRRPRRDDEDYDSDGDETLTADDDSGEDADNSSSPNEPSFSHGETEVRQQPRREREHGRERFDRGDRPDRANREVRANGARREEREDRYDETDDISPPDETGFAHSDERISLGVLPPSIGATDDEPEEEAPKPRRRARKPRAEDDGDVAPTA